MDAIRIENINFYYNRNNPVFQDLNLQVPCGAIYGLLGNIIIVCISMLCSD